MKVEDETLEVSQANESYSLTVAEGEEGKVRSKKKAKRRMVIKIKFLKLASSADSTIVSH